MMDFDMSIDNKKLLKNKDKGVMQRIIDREYGFSKQDIKFLKQIHH